MEVIGYFVEKNGNQQSANDVFVAVEKDTKAGKIAVFSPTEGHAQAQVEYVNQNCSQISREQYVAASKRWKTPLDYL